MKEHTQCGGIGGVSRCSQGPEEPGGEMDIAKEWSCKGNSTQSCMEYL